MKLKLGVIMSKEFPTFSYHSEAVSIFDRVLSIGLPEFRSDLIEEMSVRFVCVSPGFSEFFNLTILC